MLVPCTFNIYSKETQNLYESKGYPKYATKHSAGLDILASETIKILPGEMAKIPTGIHLNISKHIRDHISVDLALKSGKSSKLKISLVNGIGIIDSDYNGEIQACVVNHSKDIVTIERGESYFQLIIRPMYKFLETIRKADGTDVIKPNSTFYTGDIRVGGFGSTDKE